MDTTFTVFTDAHEDRIEVATFFDRADAEAFARDYNDEIEAEYYEVESDDDHETEAERRNRALCDRINCEMATKYLNSIREA